MSKQHKDQMKRKELEDELTRIELELMGARRLISKISEHMSKSVAFYGYEASVEDLCEENYSLQRQMQVYILDPPRDVLIEWLGNLTELLGQHRGIRPGQDACVDKVALFLGYEQWVKQDAERIGDE